MSEDYEEKYRTYKKMYLDLKYGQAGGTNDTSNINKAIDYLKQKYNGIKDYSGIISKIESYCSEKVSGVSDLKRYWDNIVNVFSEHKVDDESNEMQKFKNYLQNEGLVGTYNIDFAKRHDEICNYLLNKVIPQLKQQNVLQERFADALKNINLGDKKINIDTYVQYAKNNNLLGKDTSIESILESTSKRLDTIFNEIKAEKENVTEILNKLEFKPNKTNVGSNMVTSMATSAMGGNTTSKNTSGSTNMSPGPMSNSSDITLLSITNDFGLSKSGRKCLDECKPAKDLFGRQKGKCETDKYDYLFTKYDWDYCNINANRTPSK